RDAVGNRTLDPRSAIRFSDRPRLRILRNHPVRRVHHLLYSCAPRRIRTIQRLGAPALGHDHFLSYHCADRWACYDAKDCRQLRWASSNDSHHLRFPLGPCPRRVARSHSRHSTDSHPESASSSVCLGSPEEYLLPGRYPDEG